MAPTKGSEVTDDWSEFVLTRDRALRDRLITAHVGLVRYLARRRARSLPQHVDLDDLVANGLLGLIDAVDRFDPARGVKFETFATRRIQGSITDGLRASDWAPRSVRSAARAVHEARQALEHEIGRTPTDDEIAAHLDIDVDAVRAAMRDEASSHHESVSHHFEGEDYDSHPASAAHSDLAAEVDYERLRRLMAEATVGLPEPHRSVVALRYGAEMTLPAVGERLGMGRGKATQLYVEACLMLREELAVLA